MDEFRSNPMSTHEGLRSTSHSLRVFHYLERGLPLRVRSTQSILLMILYHGDSTINCQLHLRPSGLCDASDHRRETHPSRTNDPDEKRGAHP